MPRCSASASPIIRKPPPRSINCRSGSTALAAFAILLGLAAYVVWVWIAAARGRPRALDRDAAGRSADAAADRDRHRRSRLLRAGDVRAGAGRAPSRLRRRRGDLRVGDAARLRQPFPGRARGVRRRHAGRAVADGPGRPARRHAAVSPALLYCAVRHICNLADASGGYSRRAAEAAEPGEVGAGPDAEPNREAVYVRERGDTGA